MDGVTAAPLLPPLLRRFLFVHNAVDVARNIYKATKRKRMKSLSPELFFRLAEQATKPFLKKASGK